MIKKNRPFLEGFRLKLGGVGSDDLEGGRHTVSPSFIGMPPGLSAAAAYVYNPHLEPTVLARLMQQQNFPMGHPPQQ